MARCAPERRHGGMNAASGGTRYTRLDTPVCGWTISQRAYISSVRIAVGRPMDVRQILHSPLRFGGVLGLLAELEPNVPRAAAHTQCKVSSPMPCRASLND
ncbi:hypothetical protein BDA96_10G133900 [Sorghum bicolor]|uniref:Uncharacterized protein n=2 Tax=Sorghum bicolor TaxID=4558 RepID=A0A921Q1F9_SORBI|nr:hypothetical protein BDA96_10G133900 [Sorghum bicolor]OQU76201.1 hypothetical protein SORBI_3010G109450 [Sorghum bicolor]